MSRLKLSMLALGIIALVGAQWYRSQVFRKPAVPTRPRLMFVTGGTGPYWQITAKGARAAAKKHNIELQVEMPADESLEEQTFILARLDLKKLNGIALSPLDAKRQTPLINQIQKTTNVVTFDSDAPLSTRRSHIGTSNYGAGALCTQLVKEAIPAGGGVLVLLANLTKENMIDRKSGFEESLDHGPDSDIDDEALTDQQASMDQEASTNAEADANDEPAVPLEVVDFLIDNGNSAVTKQNILDTLGKHPDLACIVGMNAQHGPIVLSVLREQGKLDEIKIVAFDEEPDTLDGIEAGHIYATIAQDPYKYGFEATVKLFDLCQEEFAEPIVGGGTINLKAEAVRQADLSDFREKLKARLEGSEVDTAVTTE